ncbi:MAG: methyltransferase family protein [Isosphaeraceae bacterium]
MKPSPKWAVALFTVVNLAAYIGLAAWGWGGWAALMAHPARAAAVFVTVVASVVALFTRGNLSSGRREDTRNRWVFVPFVAIGLLTGWLPAYTDRVDFGTIDGDVTRYVGLALFVVGIILRMVPVFVLGRRFSGFVAIQEGHQLETRGIYGVIRHPSYLGFLIGLLGWSLVFRSIPGVVLSLFLIPPLIARISSEEALLASEFGQPYEEYRQRTWRLVPFVY